MKKILFILIAIMFFATNLKGDEPNPRLRNFKRGTGQASWWEAPRATPQPRLQTFYYPPSIRYYQPVPYYYYRHHPHCRCHVCFQRNQQIMMWQLRMNNPFFLFQVRF